MRKNLTESFGCLLIFVGVGLWSVPLALVVAGVLIVAAFEARP